MTDREKLQSLVNRFVAGNLPAEEEQELARSVAGLEQKEVSELLEQAWQNFSPGEPVFSEEETATMLRNILGEEQDGPRRLSLFRRSWFQVAAAILLVLAFVGLFNYLDRPAGGELAGTEQQPATDIAPGGNKAVLTLADGSTIDLDSVPVGMLSTQGSAEIRKTADGQVAYQTSGDRQEVLYNTISTPRGGQYQLTLADGSRVWLNAASSIRYPTAFVESYRSVEITGEVFFEVAENPARPFQVDVAGQCVIEVLGTEFNVNAYEDEEAVSTTLVEGSVRISADDGRSSVLQPGQQARLTEGVLRVRQVDTEEFVAWKSGWFVFNRADLAGIMRRISRWYDVEVVFEGEPLSRSFSGMVSRDNNVSQVLKIMENAGVRFRIEKERIIVLQ